MECLRLALLGGFEARMASGQSLCLPRAKAAAVLGILALHPGQAFARDRLASMLWPEFPEDQARHNLRQTLFTIRKSVPGLDLVVDGDSLALPPSAVTVDVAEFQALVARATPEALTEASNLYRGALFEGLRVNERPFEDWLLGERERLREMAVDAMRSLLAHHSASGSTAEAIQTALRLVAIDPLQETAHRALIGLYAAMGRRSCALRQYETCARVLKRELGVAPEPETTQLYQKVLRRETRPRDSDSAPSSARGRLEPSRLHDHVPLVGRKQEFAVLARALDGAWQGGGMSIAIVGEAGVGKTRLVEELADWAHRRGGRVLVGRSFEMEQGLSFGCWLDALRATVAGERRILEELDPTWRRELTRLFPDASGLGPAYAGAPDAYLQLFEAVARLVGRLALHRRHVLVFEDLHWADEMSLRLLSFVVHRIGDLGALVVATAREEDVADLPHLRALLETLGRDARHIRLHLAPLSRSATGALTRALARPARDAATLASLEHRVWTVSEGNPFVALEAVRALEENHPASEELRTGVSARVTEMIANRLDRLDEKASALVAAAAVIGREFESEIIMRAAGLNAPDTASGVEMLVRRRVLLARGERLDFTHARVREVAIGRLLPPRRQLVHARVAAALEHIYGGDLATHAGRLAMHYREGQVWDKAVQFLLVAGRQAAARAAHREAVTCFEQALAAVAHLPAVRETAEQTIDLYLELHQSLAVLAERDRLAAYLREAERRSAQLGDSRRLGWALCQLSRELLAGGQGAASREHAQRARAIGESVGDGPLAALASYRFSQAYLSAGDYRQARDRLGALVAAADADPSWIPVKQRGLFTIQARAWLTDEAHDLAERALAQARERGERGYEAYALWLLGDVAARREQIEVETADRHYRRAIALAAELGMQPLLARAHRGLGALCRRAGREGPAGSHLATAIAIAGSIGLRNLPGE